ncbi:MAG: carboxymuconolactone decarboxylase family protein [Chloroflexota bacterium]|nr:MAG: carboxymuconolactone decarboxylase family protein [Chloroflexota bacterium]
MARIPFVQQETASPEVAVLFAKMKANGAPPQNMWKMAAHVPSALPHFVKMGRALLTETRLAPRLREMAIVRQAEIVGCEYERKAHAAFGREVGMVDEQIAGIRDWKCSDAFDEVERAVLRFTDEAVKDVGVSDATFDALAKHLDPDMMVELALTIGFYGMIARLLMPFQVELDDDALTSPSQILGRSRS